MIHDFTVKDIREYIKNISGLEYFNIIKVEDFMMRKNRRFIYYYSIKISVSRAGDIFKLLKSKLIDDDTHIRNGTTSINSSVSLYIKQDDLMD